MAHQDDYFYEIQLSNKQLVFYFMAGATGLILSFLAGVMVGRGVDQGADVQAARTAPVEERVVTEETVRPAPPPAEELTYAQRLESDIHSVVELCAIAWLNVRDGFLYDGPISTEFAQLAHLIVESYNFYAIGFC